MPRALPTLALVAAALLGGCLSALTGDGAHRGAGDVTGAWLEAESLFRRDSRWRGADAAYSVDLGAERVLWLFGDTFLARTEGGTRRDSRMVSNTIGIQEGYDPASATMRFYWTPPMDPAGVGDLLPPDLRPEPEAFIPDDPRGLRYWPGGGTLVEERLVIFFTLITSNNDGFGFKHVAWTAFIVDDPAADPASWQPREARVPDRQFDLFAGAGGAFVRDGHLYAFANRPWKDASGWTHHEAHLLRWPVSAVKASDLTAPEWWNGVSEQWEADANLPRPPPPVFTNGAPEFSVHLDARTGKWVQVQSTGFGATPLDVRTAPRPEGPWSTNRTVYRPPEMQREDAFVYAGKAHPHLAAADFLAATYATNAWEFSTQIDDDELYYPRVVRIARADL